MKMLRAVSQVIPPVELLLNKRGTTISVFYSHLDDDDLFYFFKKLFLEYVDNLTMNDQNHFLG